MLNACLFSFKKLKFTLNVINISTYHRSGLPVASHLILAVILSGRLSLSFYRGGYWGSERAGGLFKVTQATGYGAGIRMEWAGLQILILSRLFLNRQTTRPQQPRSWQRLHISSWYPFPNLFSVTETVVGHFVAQSKAFISWPPFQWDMAMGLGYCHSDVRRSIMRNLWSLLKREGRLLASKCWFEKKKKRRRKQMPSSYLSLSFLLDELRLNDWSSSSHLGPCEAVLVGQQDGESPSQS